MWQLCDQSAPCAVPRGGEGVVPGHIGRFAHAAFYRAPVLTNPGGGDDGQPPHSTTITVPIHCRPRRAGDGRVTFESPKFVHLRRAGGAAC